MAQICLMSQLPQRPEDSNSQGPQYFTSILPKRTQILQMCWSRTVYVKTRHSRTASVCVTSVYVNSRQVTSKRVNVFRVRIPLVLMIKTVTSKRVKLRQFTSKRVIGLNCFSLGASSYVSLRQNAVPPRMTAFVNAQELLFGGSGMCKNNIPHCVVALPLPLSSTVFFVSAFLPFFFFLWHPVQIFVRPCSPDFIWISRGVLGYSAAQADG